MLVRSAVISLSVVALAFPAAAQTASGEFRVEGRRPITPRYAAAYEVRDPRDARGRAIEIALTSTPVDLAAIVAALDPHSAAANDPALRNDHYVLLWVRADGSVTMNATFSDSMTQYIDMTRENLRAELTTNTPDRIAGRLFTSAPVRAIGGESYSVELTFSAPVARLPAGQRLGAHGGAPGKAFKRLAHATARKKWSELRDALAPEQLAEIEHAVSADDRAAAMESLATLIPHKGIRITGGELHGGRAVLEVESEIYAGRRALYLVELRQSGNKWLFYRAITAGLLLDQ